MHRPGNQHFDDMPQPLREKPVKEWLTSQHVQGSASKCKILLDETSELCEKYKSAQGTWKDSHVKYNKNLETIVTSLKRLNELSKLLQKWGGKAYGNFCSQFENTPYTFIPREGNFSDSTGDISASKGDISASTGDISASEGDISASKGYISDPNIIEMLHIAHGPAISQVFHQVSDPKGPAPGLAERLRLVDFGKMERDHCSYKAPKADADPLSAEEIEAGLVKRFERRQNEMSSVTSERSQIHGCNSHLQSPVAQGSTNVGLSFPVRSAGESWADFQKKYQTTLKAWYAETLKDLGFMMYTEDSQEELKSRVLPTGTPGTVQAVENFAGFHEAFCSARDDLAGYFDKSTESTFDKTTCQEKEKKLETARRDLLAQKALVVPLIRPGDVPEWSERVRGAVNRAGTQAFDDLSRRVRDGDGEFGILSFP